jgi:hypothetical protein
MCIIAYLFSKRNAKKKMKKRKKEKKEKKRKKLIPACI